MLYGAGLICRARNREEMSKDLKTSHKVYEGMKFLFSSM